MIWLQFLFCLAAIGFGGAWLSRYGDAIAEKTGLGRTWAGLVLMATVTSLPELVTGVSAVTMAGVLDIAVGDVLGSCVFNLGLLVVIDFLYREQPVYTRASRGHILAAGFGVILIGLAGLSVLLAHQGAMPTIAHVGLYSPLIVALYLVAMRMVFHYARSEMAEFVESAVLQYKDITLRRAVAGYGLAAAVVLVAGSWLPFLGDELARRMGWNHSFVGTLLVAAVTSAPEVAVSFAALRLGALDMAIANLLGSNLFDILIIAIDDLAYLKGAILADVSPAHAYSAFSAIVMTGTAIVGLFYRPTARLASTVGWISLFLLGVYVVNSYVLFRYGR